MHGLIVLGFNGAVVFHTSPLTRAVVDHIAEIVQSDLHMTVASQYFSSVAPNKGGGGNFRDGDNSNNATSSFTSSRNTVSSPALSTRGAVHSTRMDNALGGSTLGASTISRSQSNALYRASVAIDRSGNGAQMATNNSSFSSLANAGEGRARTGSAFSPKEVESLSGPKKPRRFQFMSRSTENAAAQGSMPPAAMGTTSAGSAQSYFISDAAFATSSCMARNCGGVCDGIIALSPSEHAWLRHHITLFVSIGEPRKEEADEDLMAADSEAVARVGVPQNGTSNSTLEIVGVGRQGEPNSPSTTASTAVVFTRGVTVVPAQQQQPSGQANLNNSQGASLSATKFVNPTTTAGGGIVLDPSVSSGELFVMVYWRKIGDRVFILVLHEEDSTALAKHVLSAFVVLLAEAFKQYVQEGVAPGTTGGGTSGAASHPGMQYQHAAAGGNGGGSSDSASKMIYSQMERVMREDSALAQLPPLRAMLQRPDMVQRCVDIVAPQNIMAMVDLPMARVCLHRSMKAK